MMQIKAMAYSYIQFYIYASPVIETRGHINFEKHVEKRMTTTGVGK